MWESSSNQESSARRSRLVNGPCMFTMVQGGCNGMETTAPMAHGTRWGSNLLYRDRLLWTKSMTLGFDMECAMGS